MKDLGDEEFYCGRNMTTQFVTFTMKYGVRVSKRAILVGASLKFLCSV
jgi:hypothetical protein